MNTTESTQQKNLPNDLDGFPFLSPDLYRHEKKFTEPLNTRVHPLLYHHMVDNLQYFGAESIPFFIRDLLVEFFSGQIVPRSFINNTPGKVNNSEITIELEKAKEVIGRLRTQLSDARLDITRNQSTITSKDLVIESLKQQLEESKNQLETAKKNHVSDFEKWIVQETASGLETIAETNLQQSETSLETNFETSLHEEETGIDLHKNSIHERFEATFGQTVEESIEEKHGKIPKVETNLKQDETGLKQGATNFGTSPETNFGTSPETNLEQSETSTKINYFTRFETKLREFDETIEKEFEKNKSLENKLRQAEIRLTESSEEVTLLTEDLDKQKNLAKTLKERLEEAFKRASESPQIPEGYKVLSPDEQNELEEKFKKSNTTINELIEQKDFLVKKLGEVVQFDDSFTSAALVKTATDIARGSRIPFYTITQPDIIKLFLKYYEIEYANAKVSATQR